MDDGFLCNHPLLFLLFFLILIIAIIVFSCLFIKYCKTVVLFFEDGKEQWLKEWQEIDLKKNKKLMS